MKCSVIRSLAFVTLCACASLVASSCVALAEAKSEPKRILIVTATGTFHHRSCEEALPVMWNLSWKTKKFTIEYSSDTTVLTRENLKKYDALMFINTTGDLAQFPITEASREAVIDFVKEGRPFIGCHAAADTLRDWAPYYEMIGGSFTEHPWREHEDPVTIRIEDPSHPSASMLPSPWTIREEIYQFHNFNRDNVHVILSLQDPVYKGSREDNDYAVAWSKYYGKGRVFYTNLGHHIHVWKDPLFQQHLLGGIYWALDIGDAAQAKIDIGRKKIDSKWVPLFDGTLDFGVDWETSDDPAQTRKHWTVLPGNVLQGYCDESDPAGSSHLYYTERKFKNFEYRADININKTGNSGLYFRCPKSDNYTDGRWKNFPRGLEAQVNNAYDNDPKKSGTFYPQPALTAEDIRKLIGYGTIPDYGHFWFHMHVVAVDNHIVIKLNGNVVVDLYEPKDSKRYSDEGYFAFQLHHRGTRVRFKNVEVRELP